MLTVGELKLILERYNNETNIYIDHGVGEFIFEAENTYDEDIRKERGFFITTGDCIN